MKVRPLAALYEKHHVDIALNGHIHLYERTWPIKAGKVDTDGGVIYLTSGGGGGGLENFAAHARVLQGRITRGSPLLLCDDPRRHVPFQSVRSEWYAL